MQCMRIFTLYFIKRKPLKDHLIFRCIGIAPRVTQRIQETVSPARCSRSHFFNHILYADSHLARIILIPQ